MTNLNRYALRNGTTPVELPQWTHLRIAMGLSLNEKDPTATALEFYDHMSRLEYLPGGSTRINAGTNFPQLSNCFVINVDDDMEAIAKAVTDTMFIAKGTGGIGIGFTKLRAAGSPVKTTNTESTGPIPFMKMIDSALFAVSRKGKKAGAAALFIENWHMNFEQFLDLRQNSGDPYLRTRFANTAVFISDEFMRRVEKRQDWYLFDPAETPELTELYGQDFDKKYAEYVKKAEKGELRTFKKLPAREQYRQILISLQATSHPWLTWKDAINMRALNNNTGTIHLSNLCTEITLPQDREHIATCNLASINLSAFLHEGAWDWERLESATRAAIHQLDNLVDITETPVEAAMKSDHATRALGLGIMGLADVLEKLGLSYADAEAADLIDNLAEFISYHAIDESANLAKTRDSYPDYVGSGWSKGLVPVDTIKQLDSARGETVKVDRSAKLDWDKLRVKVKKGMRNATLMAIAPTANIAHVAGTTPGIDPEFSQIFSRSTLNGKFLEVNGNLVQAIKNLGKWEELKDELLANQGDIQQMDLPDDLKKIYLTSFQLPPEAFIEIAARAQKWVDQAISRNMYLETRDIDQYEEIYLDAWRRGLKTTYYLHVKPRHQSEQITAKPAADKVKVGGAKKPLGFGFAKGIK
jgi:ribonucleoside-diphosphate reductase alpha chain